MDKILEEVDKIPEPQRTQTLLEMLDLVNKKRLGLAELRNTRQLTKLEKFKEFVYNLVFGISIISLSILFFILIYVLVQFALYIFEVI